MGKKAHGGGHGHTIAPNNLSRFFGVFWGSVKLGPRASNKTAWSKSRAPFFFFFIQEMMVINRWASSLEKKSHDTARSRDEKHDPREARKGGTNGTKD